MKNKIMLDKNNIPKHIAFIIDGNGRWALQRGMPRNYGHKMGLNNLIKILKSARKIGVKIVSIFAFSTENWKRPKKEVDFLFKLFENQAASLLKKDNFDGVCYRHMGDASKFPPKLQKDFATIIEKTKNNVDFIVNLGINYGGRDELVRCFNKLNKQNLANITEADILNNLDTAFLPNPDFIIRTSGEERISNFMLFQMAYSELYFTKTYWPAFTQNDLKEAILNYQTRNRKYGALKENNNEK